MKIGINCLRTWPGYKGGINSFTFGLLGGFVNVGRDYEFNIFINSSNRHLFEDYAAMANFRLVEVNEYNKPILRRLYNALPWPVRYERWVTALFNRVLESEYDRELESNSDVIFVPYCPSPLFPFPVTPTVYSIHDIQHVHYPEFFTAEQLAERGINLFQCVEHARLIQASSRHMRDDFLMNLPGLTADRVSVIPEGVDIETFSSRAGTDVRAKYELPERFLFFPAQLWHHKNHITVLKALKRLRDDGLVVPLILTGGKYEAADGIFEFIERNALGDQVYYLGLVPSADIVGLYQTARFLITAVLYESSSIPVLEAAAAGTPIIASRTPPNEELAEHLAMTLFPPTDDAVLAELLVSLWNDDGQIRDQVVANRTSIRHYSWDNAARQYLMAFQSIAAH